MKCKNCGGELVYRDGTYVCESCGSRASVADYYDATEAFICCVDNDAAGRRTRDSIIAQDVYNALSSNKVNTFCGRISAGDLAGEEYEAVCNAALHSARTVVVVGTEKQHFEALNEKYADFFAGRTVIPVFSEMDAYDIPKGMSAVQALDYGRVGAVTDLVKGVLNTLGRASEIDVVRVAHKAMSKRKKLKIAAISVGAFLAVVAALAALFLSLRPAEMVEETNSKYEQEKANDEKYAEAVKLTEEGEFGAALAKFGEISGYKDSDKLRTNIYNKYAGYYTDEDKNVTLYIQVWNGNVVHISVVYANEDGDRSEITDVVTAESDTVEFEFNDSANNRGVLTAFFENDAVTLDIKTTEVLDPSLSIGDIKLSFPVSERSDKPRNEVTFDDLMGFVKEYTTYGMLKKSGIELEFVGPIYRSNDEAVYQIKNTDFYVYIDHTLMYSEGIDRDDSPVKIVSLPETYFGNVGETVTLPEHKGIVFIDSIGMGIDDFYFETMYGRTLTVEEKDQYDRVKEVYITGINAIGEEEFSSLVEYGFKHEINVRYAREYLPWLNEDDLTNYYSSTGGVCLTTVTDVDEDGCVVIQADDYSGHGGAPYPSMVFRADPNTAELTLIDTIEYTVSIVEPYRMYDEEYQARVHADGGLNFRAGPGTEYETLHMIDDGDICTVLGENADGNWYCVEHGMSPYGDGSAIGWVNANYVEIID